MSEMQRVVNKVKEGPIVMQDLRDLSKLTLARIMTFNARRGGECSKLTLQHWKGVEDERWKQRTYLENLDGIEKKLAERMQLCYIEGKKKAKGSKNALVPILFTTETTEAIQLLILHRSVMGMKEENNYVFASGDLFLRGWDTLQGITKQISNLKKPNLITPTRTRKFLATLLQLMDMNEAELSWVTNHFGHTKSVHFQWYRKEDATVELTKVAKVLVAIDDGKNVKNKKIDEIGENELPQDKETDIDIDPLPTDKHDLTEVKSEPLNDKKRFCKFYSFVNFNSFRREGPLCCVLSLTSSALSRSYLHQKTHCQHAFHLILQLQRTK